MESGRRTERSRRSGACPMSIAAPDIGLSFLVGTTVFPIHQRALCPELNDLFAFVSQNVLRIRTKHAFALRYGKRIHHLYST